MSVVCCGWVRVAIVKPSDEPLRKGETQRNVLPTCTLVAKCTHLLRVRAGPVFRLVEHLCTASMYNTTQHDA